MPERVRGRFECGHCGSIEIIVPEKPEDESIVTCASCGRGLATWRTIRPLIPDRAFQLDSDPAGKRIRLKEV